MFNLNNRFVFLLPPFQIIRERFEKRGDDIHKNVFEIKTVYDAFEKEFKLLSRLPNALPYFGVATPKAVEALCATLEITERTLLREVSDQVFSVVEHCEGECFPLQFTLYDDGDFEEASRESMAYKPEKEYYEKLDNQLHEKITCPQHFTLHLHSFHFFNVMSQNK